MRVSGYRVRRMHIFAAKNGVWTYRRRVESGLEEAFSNFTGNKQPQFKRSLGTKDRREAEKLALAAEVEYSSLMQKLRYQAHLSPDELRNAHLSLRVGGLLKSAKAKLDLEIVQKLKAEIDAELDRYKAKVKAADDLDKLKKVRFGKQHKKYMPLGEYYKHLQNAARILHTYERMFTEPQLDISKELEATRRSLQESQLGLGEFFLETLQRTQTANSDVLAKRAMNKGKAPQISVALERWKEKNKPSESSYNEWKYTVNRFIELHGDLAVDTIDDEHIVQFREAISKIPARLSPKLLALPIHKLIEKADKGEFKDKPERSVNTVRKMIVGLSTILQVMADDGYIHYNPARKKAPKSDDDGSKCPPYELDELRKLFTSRYYQRDYWHSPVKDKPSRFWSPLLALYTGCRAGEIAALQLKDVRQSDENIWYLSINRNNAKSLKTKSAVRDIPLHKDLIRMGFLTYVEQAKKQGYTQLLTDINPERRNISGTISNPFGRYIESIGLKTDGKSFHSFRDCFSDACVNSGLDDRTTDRLLGHKMQGVKKHYGKGLWLSTAKELVDKLYKGKVDLSHLYVKGKA